jgi:hypothetical protein
MFADRVRVESSVDDAGSAAVHRDDTPSSTDAPLAIPGLARHVQPKLMVGAVDDPHEHEADQIAHQVVAALARRSSADAPAEGLDAEIGRTAPVVARVASPGSVSLAGGEAEPGVEQALRSASSGGAALPQEIRRDMEGALGTDLGAVRIHTGSRATQLNEEISARAFTKGDDIFFRDGMPDTETAAGQELLAHELVHTVQQSQTARRSADTVRRKPPKVAKTLDPVDDWEEFSKVSGTLGNKARSKELKEIDRTVKAWRDGARPAPGNLKGNVDQLKNIFDAIDAWQTSKKGSASVRDGAVAALTNHLTPIQLNFTARALKQSNDEAVAKPLFDKFKLIDAETGKFAGKNTTDIKQARFEPDNQSAGLMPHTKKNDDGTLTDEAMDALDAEQKEEARKLVEVAHNCQLRVDPSVTPEQIRELMASDTNENALTGRTKLPELQNASDPNAETSVEVTEKIDGVDVTYDKSDVHAAERIASLRKAIGLINATKVRVPATLTVYFPKYGRDITVASDCSIKPGAKIADAVFHPPNFLAVSSANTGNAKEDKTGGELKFLSAQLGPDDALVHTLIHEIGHAMHYHNDRSRFYNLNFAFFKGKHSDGRSYQQIAESEVSGYGNNPREMVAEVFVGAVTGKKTFSPIVWEMYTAFGGADPR